MGYVPCRRTASSCTGAGAGRSLLRCRTCLPGAIGRMAETAGFASGRPSVFRRTDAWRLRRWRRRAIHVLHLRGDVDPVRELVDVRLGVGRRSTPASGSPCDHLLNIETPPVIAREETSAISSTRSAVPAIISPRTFVDKTLGCEPSDRALLIAADTALRPCWARASSLRVGWIGEAARI